MKILLLGVVLVVCRADVTEHINERVFGKIIKTVITKALSSVDNVIHKTGNDVQEELMKDAKLVLGKAAIDLKLLLQRPHKLSEGKLVKSFVNGLKNEITERIEDKLKSIYHAIKTSRLKRAPVHCHSDLDRTLGIFSFINTLDFRDLNNAQQIFMFEILAAGEKCELHEFLTPETSERLFNLMDEMPMKYVHYFLQYLFQSLKSEGVSSPVQ